MTDNSDKTGAVVLLSGGLDSATVAAHALKAYGRVTALSFRYGQRHQAELVASERIAHALGLTDHRIVDVDLGQLGGSSLTDPHLEVPAASAPGSNEIPNTYVPARNTVFVAYGLAVAEVTQASAILLGINAVDYSGYPDCRPEFVEAWQSLINVATRQTVSGQSIRLEAPLLMKSKAEIVQWGTRLGVDYSQTVSCYRADDQGRACGRCDSCELRRQGFLDARLPDPTRYQPDGSR